MTTRNHVTELCELVVRVEPSQGTAGELSCNVELRLASGDIDLGGEVCEVSISRLTVALDLEGLTAVPGSRYGEPRRPSVVEQERVTTQKNDASRSFKAAAGATLDMAGPSLGASASGEVRAEVHKETVLKSEDRFVHNTVAALPNLRWEVREVDDRRLQGTYLEGDCLLRLTPAERANRSAVVARTTVKQRDVSIDQVVASAVSFEFFKKMSNTKRKLMELFIKKSLDSALQGSGKFTGEITLSVAEVDVAEIASSQIGAPDEG